MKLRQKLFLAVLAVMGVFFGLLALVGTMLGLEAQQSRRKLESRLELVALEEFRRAAASVAEDRWAAFAERLDELGLAEGFQVAEAGSGDIAAAAGWPTGAEAVASEDGYDLFRERRAVEFEPVRAVIWMLSISAVGTLLLVMVLYGLLLRLVLRPVEDLAGSTARLGRGERPSRVAGETRADEIGDLIRDFNAMADEVFNWRQELERRVDTATANYERASRQLVLEQRLAATGKLAAGIAHEINNPLGGMMNAARTLARDEGLEGRSREYLGLIEEGLARIARIVERMRSFVRPKPSVGKVDLAATARSALQFVGHRMQAEGVALRDELGVEAVTVGDAQELQQVFLNLMVNALDAMKDAERKELAVRLHADGALARLSVEDTGCGVDSPAQASVFDLFYTTKGEEGSGLGLAIAHKIVTDHGGTIDVESARGEGARFIVSLPLAMEGTGA